MQLFLPSNTVSHLKGVVRRTVRTPFSAMKNGMGIDYKRRAYGHFITNSWRIDKSALSSIGKPCVSEISDDKPKAVAEERRQHKRINIELKGMSGRCPSPAI
jgi:hypothetical protein